MIQKAILSYYEKLKLYPDYFRNENYGNIEDSIRLNLQNGIAPVKRTTKTDLQVFKNRYGYELPKEIQEYINLYWHSFICGFHSKMKRYSDEAIVLFSVLKYSDETDDDILYHPNGLLEMMDRRKKYFDDIQQYIPIGWTSYSGGSILYDRNTSKIYIEDMDEKIIQEPIADNLAELISQLEVYSWTFLF